SYSVDGVIHEIEPDLVQLAAVRLDPWQRRIVLSRHLDALLELVTQHDQRIVQALAKVDLLDGGSVHIDILLDRLYQGGNSCRRTAELIEQACCRQTGGDPPED